ncbi:MAG TPA: hypothetical protein VH764_10955 [Gemmatimonadales bacterium]
MSLVALPVLAAVPARGQQPDIEANLHGLILMNGFHTTDNVNNSDVPQFAIPASPTSPEGSASGASIRQSRVTAFALVPEFSGGVLEGELDVDFYGGQQPSTGGRTFPLLRVRRAIAKLTWNRVALLVGQESPPIAAVSPSSIASVGFPDFAGAGNLWLWIPQIRLSADLPSSGAVRIGAEIAALAPTSGDPQGAFLTQPDIAERSGRPFLQGRVRGRWGQGEQLGEVSAGGHYGWIVDAAGDRVPSRGLAVSVWTPIGRKLDFRAEAFTGQALAGLGGGGIGQNMVVDGVPVGTAGGWAQLNLRPTEQWEIGGGGGIDDPNDEDLVEASRLRNLAIEGHVTWRKLPAVVGMEVRHLRTRYRAPLGDLTATHVNLGMGFEF